MQYSHSLTSIAPARHMVFIVALIVVDGLHFIDVLTGIVFYIPG